MSGTGLLTYASPWQNEPGNKNNNTLRKRTPTLSQPTIRNKTVKKTPLLSNMGEPEEYPSLEMERENFQSLTPSSIDSVQQENDKRASRVQDIINNIGSVKTENDGNDLANYAPVKNVKSAIPGFNHDEHLGNSYGSYKEVYTPGSNIGEVSYFKPAAPTVSPVGDKVMEKINYVIHLLEEQQHEPTKHITEEFILYTFLGVFVIYVVDSFARAGKYIR